MNKNIVHTLACERKRTTHSHEITSTRNIYSKVQQKNKSHITNNLPKRDVLSRYLLR
jgi:hypothetical protein